MIKNGVNQDIIESSRFISTDCNDLKQALQLNYSASSYNHLKVYRHSLQFTMQFDKKEKEAKSDGSSVT